jgi:hypothetical protein
VTYSSSIHINSEYHLCRVQRYSNWYCKYFHSLMLAVLKQENITSSGIITENLQACVCAHK